MVQVKLINTHLSFDTQNLKDPFRSTFRRTSSHSVVDCIQLIVVDAIDLVYRDAAHKKTTWQQMSMYFNANKLSNVWLRLIDDEP